MPLQSLFWKQGFQTSKSKTDELNLFLQPNGELIAYPRLDQTRQSDDILCGGIAGIHEIIRMLITHHRAADFLSAQSHMIDEPRRRQFFIFGSHYGVLLKFLAQFFVLDNRIHKKRSGTER